MSIFYLFLHTGSLPVLEMATDAVYFKMMDLDANEAFKKFSLEFLSCMSWCFTWIFTFLKNTQLNQPGLTVKWSKKEKKNP